jgi:hypothetical protein
VTSERRLLMDDRLRRTNRWVPLLLAAFAGGAWWAGPYFEPAGRAMTTSMGIALLAGPQVALQYVPRCLWYLPLSHRDIWRANWLVSTVGVTLLTTLAKLLALLVPASEAGSLPPGSIALSALYDFAATGIGCSLIVIATRPKPLRRALHAPWAIAKSAAEFTLPVIGMALFYVPAWVGVVPPGRWSELGLASSVILAALVGLAIATWFHVPTPLTPANRLAPPENRAKATPRVVRAPRVTGIARLLIREAGWAFAIAGSFAAAGVLIVLVLARVGRDQRFLMQFLRDALHVADVGGASAGDMGYVAFNLLIWYALFASAMATRFPLILRHLRALPVKAARLNALLVAWPALIWVTAWAGGTLLHYVALGHRPVRPHAPAIAALIGICALVQAISLRFSTVTRLMVFASAAGLVPFAGLIPGPPPTILIVLGAACLIAAAVVNHSALATSGTYRALPLPIGSSLSR